MQHIANKVKKVPPPKKCQVDDVGVLSVLSDGSAELVGCERTKNDGAGTKTPRRNDSRTQTSLTSNNVDGDDVPCRCGFGVVAVHNSGNHDQLLTGKGLVICEAMSQ
eukprot:7754471-Karenia_brevis.AAC.1